MVLDDQAWIEPSFWDFTTKELHEGDRFGCSRKLFVLRL